jgi:hypothetical protein
MVSCYEFPIQIPSECEVTMFRWGSITIISDMIARIEAVDKTKPPTPDMVIRYGWGWSYHRSLKLLWTPLHNLALWLDPQECG